MTLSSRRSTFPPVLQAYYSGVEPTVGINSPLQTPPQWKAPMVPVRSRGCALAAKDSIKTVADWRKNGAKGGSSSGVRLLLRNEHELKLRKKAKRAEGMLKSWDALQQKERDEKHSFLQQRVKLQHDLIAKVDELSEEIRTKAAEEQHERIKSRKASHREIVDALRAHMQKAEEHKKMVADKREFEDLGNPSTESTTGKDAGMLAMEAQESDNELKGSEDTPNNKSKTTALTQLFGIDLESDQLPDIESMWDGWKSNTNRKLRPVAQYSQKLKKVASPSAKQCLNVYEGPTAHDRYTGKPIPLKNVLSEVARTSSGGPQSYRTGVMQQSARQNQKRAAILLSRKAQLDANTTREPEWYGMNCEDPQLMLQSVTAGDKPSHSEQRCRISPWAKKKLPSYLTPSGDLVAGSLEEFGDKFYCGPSKRKDQHVESVFLTDLQLENETMKCPSSVDNQHRSTSPGRKSFGWQPLSSGALAEHRTVTELPVQGFGHLTHGNYKMWKPIPYNNGS